MSYISVSVEVDFWDVWDSMSHKEKVQRFKQLRGYFKTQPEPEGAYRMIDPVQRLAAITELRALGYTVETA